MTREGKEAAVKQSEAYYGSIASVLDSHPLNDALENPETAKALFERDAKIFASLGNSYSNFPNIFG